MSASPALHAGAALLVVVASAACTGTSTTRAISQPDTEAVATSKLYAPGSTAAGGTAATTEDSEPAKDVVVLLTAPTPGLGESIGTVDPRFSPPDVTAVPTPPTEQAYAVRPPASGPAVVGTWYEYYTDHCGVGSPIDFDGSFWIPVAASDDPHYDIGNSRPGRIALVDDDSALLLMDSGVVVLLERHDQATWFYICL